MINVHDMLIIYVNAAANSDIRKNSKKTSITLNIWEDHIKSFYYYFYFFIVTTLGTLFNTSAHKKMFDQIFQRNQQQNMSNKGQENCHCPAFKWPSLIFTSKYDCFMPFE